LEQIANQNNLTGEQFIQALRNAQILPSALLDQIRAELTWQNVVQTSLRREVEIRPQEVDAVVERILGGADQRQYRVAEIFLAIPDIQQEEEVLQNAQRLVQQAREGANFSGLARQFSESSTANLGGDLGWMSGGQLQEELNRVLVSMSPGQVSDPIRTLTGFTILLLRDVRATTEDSIDRDQIEQSLAQERLNQLAQRRLQELRRSASIDVRI
jgi:peptidyl-prolyl cis-trans isomerase SurA